MQDNTLFVKRRGNVCTIYTDGPGGKPVAISSLEDEPGFPNTMTYSDVMANYGGCDLRWVEAPKPIEAPPRSKDPKIAEQVAQLKAQYDGQISDTDRAAMQARAAQIAASRGRKVGPTNPEPTSPPTQTTCAMVGKDSRTIVQVPEGVANFLKTLKVAARYASKENRDMLKIKIETVKELIEEVWDGPTEKEED